MRLILCERQRGRIKGRDSAKGEYEDVSGFCKSATLDEIEAAGWALTPGHYVGAPEAPEDSEPIDEKIARLTKSLAEALDESARLDAVVREDVKARLRANIKRLLRKYGYPPDKQPLAIAQVMEQMEAFAPRMAQEREESHIRK